MLLVVEEILLLGIKGPADRCLVRAQKNQPASTAGASYATSSVAGARFPQPEPPLPVFYPLWYAHPPDAAHQPPGGARGRLGPAPAEYCFP